VGAHTTKISALRRIFRMCADRSHIFRFEKWRGGVAEFSSDGEKISVTTRCVCCLQFFRMCADRSHIFRFEKWRVRIGRPKPDEAKELLTTSALRLVFSYLQNEKIVFVSNVVEINLHQDGFKNNSNIFLLKDVHRCSSLVSI